MLAGDGPDKDIVHAGDDLVDRLDHHMGQHLPDQVIGISIRRDADLCYEMFIFGGLFKDFK